MASVAATASRFSTARTMRPWALSACVRPMRRKKNLLLTSRNRWTTEWRSCGMIRLPVASARVTWKTARILASVMLPRPRSPAGHPAPGHAGQRVP